MKIKMLKDAFGSPDGIKVVSYLKGEVHKVEDALGRVFVRDGSAEEVKPSKKSAPAGNKADAPADSK